MTLCPRCHQELDHDSEQDRRCPHCHASLDESFSGGAETINHGLSTDADDDTSASEKPTLVDSMDGGAATIDHIHDQTLDLSSEGVSDVDVPSSSFDLGRHPTDAPSGTLDFAGDLTKSLQSTWHSAAADSTPEMTIKADEDAPSAEGKSTLVIQSRALKQADEPDASLADYDLLGQLGAGGMGVVYSARQASIDRTVAVKMLKSHQDSGDEKKQQKFLAEAVVTGELDHPNIVPIYDLGRNADGALFYSMKRVEGTPWCDMLTKNSLPENVEILLKVADAVAFAHSRGVVHRDLKPENIMLGDYGEVLVLDWGLALTTADCRKTPNLVSNTGMGGTPAYMAPEMAMGPVDQIGKSSDIYLLGAILFECITGLPPHAGKKTMECLMAAGKNEIVQTDKSGELLDIALHAMATNPSDRYESVQAFQEAIRVYQSHSESVSLSARATSDLKAAEVSDDYNDYAKALYVFEEAYQLWTANSQAKSGISQAKTLYASSALRKQDYDLGLSVLDADDPDHQELREQLTAGQAERDARRKRLQNARRAIVGLIAAVMVAVTAGIIAAKRQEAEAKRQERIAKANEAKAIEQEAEAKRQEEIAKANAVEAKNQETEAKRQEQLAKENATQAIRNAEEAKYEEYVATIGLAASRIDENAVGQAVRLLQGCDPALRDWEWRHLMHVCLQGRKQFHLDERLELRRL